MLSQLGTLLWFAAINLAAFALGRPLIAAPGVARDDRLQRNVWRLATGLLLAAAAVAALGCAGLWQRSLLEVLTVAACCAHLPLLWISWRAKGHAAAGEAGAGPSEDFGPATGDSPGRPLLAVVFFLSGIACLGALLVALSPPTAGDAWGYRLESPKRFLAEQRFVRSPGEDASLPALSEMWNLWAMALDGPVCAQLVHWEWGLLLGLATVLLAAPIVGRSWSWIAGAGALLMPGVCGPLGAAPEELPAAALAALALAAWWSAAVGQQRRQWYVLAGLAAAGAAGVSRGALLLPLAVAPVWLWLLRDQLGRRRVWAAAAAAVALVAISLAGSLLWPRLPVEGPPSGELGALLAALLPGLLLTRKLRGLSVLLAVALGYWLFACLAYRDARLPLPVVPMLVVAGVWVAIELRRFPIVARRVTAAALLALAAAGVAHAVPWACCRERMAVALGVESREHFLLGHEPTFSAVLLSRLFVGPDAHILSQEPHTFYFDRQVTPERSYRQASPNDDWCGPPSALGERLRRDGFSHLLLVETPSGTAASGDATLNAWADGQLRDGSAAIHPLGEYRFCAADGSVRRYRLIELR